MTSSPRSWVRRSARSRSGIPVGLRPQRAPVLVLEVAQARAQVGGERRQFRRGRAIGRSRPSPRSSARTPDTQPRQLSCATTTVISAIDQPPSAADEEDQVAPRVLAAPLDEAHVVQEHQLGDRAGLAVDRVHADVHRRRRRVE